MASERESAKVQQLELSHAEEEALSLQEEAEQKRAEASQLHARLERRDRRVRQQGTEQFQFKA